MFAVDARTLDTMFRRARARAGLDGFHFHDLRHTAATGMAGRVHVLELCKIMGWRNPKMAMVYFNPRPRDIAARLG